jgi:predicted anti-sigma-YlaC factor YlaD
MGAVRSAECERVRVLVSLALDGGLSQVEQASLSAHVRRCAACAGFARDVEGLTRMLRTAPLERSAVAFAHPRRRSAMRTLQLGAAAAAVMLAAGLGSLAGSLNHSGGHARVTASAAPSPALWRALALTGTRMLPSNGTRPIPV